MIGEDHIPYEKIYKNNLHKTISNARFLIKVLGSKENSVERKNATYNYLSYPIRIDDLDLGLDLVLPTSLPFKIKTDQTDIKNCRLLLRFFFTKCEGFYVP